MDTRVKCGPARQLPGAPAFHWNIWKNVAIKLRIPAAKEFLLKLKTVWARALKKRLPALA